MPPTCWLSARRVAHDREGTNPMELIWNLILSTFDILPIYLIAALGGYLSQRVGVYDVSMEGNMTLSALLGLLGFYLTGSPWLGLAFGFAGGMVFGLILGSLAVRWNLNQIVLGFGLWYVGMGLAGTLFKLYLPQNFTSTGFPSLAEVIGISGPFEGIARLLDLNIIFYLSILLVIVLNVITYQTKLGVYMRAAGENPAAVDAAGINLFRLRFFAVLVGTGIVGVAGALLSVHFLQGFTQNMVAGRGWIAFAIVIFGRWRPVGITLGCLLFAGIFALQIRLQTMGVALPSELMTALPYIATLLMLTIIMSQSRSFKMPSALGLPYYRE
jgi:ABC-type uncharacterized transport system permease subunit